MIPAGRYELHPLTSAAAALLLDDREAAGRLLAAHVPDSWPQPDLVRVLPRFAAQPDSVPHFGAYAVIDPCTRAVAGDIGFHGPPDDHSGEVEIGYAIVPERRREGIASTVARALSDWALARDDVRAIVAGCDPSNVGSIATLKLAGFVRNGEHQDLASLFTTPNGKNPYTR